MTLKNVTLSITVLNTVTLSVVMLSVVILSVVILSVVMLSVVMPLRVANRSITLSVDTFQELHSRVGFWPYPQTRLESPARNKHSSLLHSKVGFWPYPQTLD